MSNPNWINRVVGLDANNAYDLWKDLRREANAMRNRLWFVGALLLVLSGALLVLTQQLRIVELVNGFPGFTVLIPWAGLLIGLIGLAICVLLYVATRDHRDRMLENQALIEQVKQEGGAEDDEENRPAISGGVRGTFITMAGLLGIAFVTILFASFGGLIGTCGSRAAAAPAGKIRHVTLLSINDVYRIEGVGRGQRGGLARVRSLRKKLEAEDKDLIMLHAGDALYPSLMSKMYDGEQMIDVLNLLDGSKDRFDKRFFATFGNHEFDKGKRSDVHILANRIKESGFTWLRTNIAFATDKSGAPMIAGDNLKKTALITANGVKVGLFSLTIDNPRPEYIADFGKIVAVARRTTRTLRDKGAEIVVALTHETVDADMKILHKLRRDGPDLIIGGHEHTRQYKNVGGRQVLKADADAVSALVVHITVKAGEAPIVTHDYVSLAGDMPAPDPDVQKKVAWWQEKHNTEFCNGLNPPKSPDCLDASIGKTAVTLVGAEEDIRACETNLGNWIADQMRLAFPGADAAFINSGSFRLNENLSPGPILRRDFESLLYYNNKLKLVSMSGAKLKEVLRNSVSGWPGNGRWLQISGFAYRNNRMDAANPIADEIVLLGPNGERTPIAPDTQLKIVTTDFLLSGGDGYKMPKEDVVDLTKNQDRKKVKKIKTVILEALEKAKEGIGPSVEDRIVQTDEKACAAGKD